MILTTSNVISDSVPVVYKNNGSVSASTSIQANLTDQDFSTFFEMESGETHLKASFGATGFISYVAVAGHNAGGAAGGTLNNIRVNDGATTIATVSVKSDQVAVVVFESRSFSDLTIVAHNSTPSEPIRVKYMAAGNYLTVPNGGEQAGYTRQYLQRNFKNKTTVNGSAEPIALLRKRIQAKGKLSIPNATVSFCENEWMDFLDFSQENHFFILEKPRVLVDSGIWEGDAPAAYLCYELDKNSVKAHASTRLLNNISIGFKVYNGL